MRASRDARSGLEVLDREACLRLLREREVGRLGVVDHGRPVIFPVNYAVDGDTLVFRSDTGTKLEGSRTAPVALQIDEVDPASRAGWSVLVTGYAEEITSFDPPRVQRLRTLPLRPWAGGEKAHWVRIVPLTITGRRIPPDGGRT